MESHMAVFLSLLTVISKVTAPEVPDSSTESSLTVATTSEVSNSSTGSSLTVATTSEVQNSNTGSSLTVATTSEVQNSSTGSSLTVATTSEVQNSNTGSPLKCYSCRDTFDAMDVWNPNTNCQTNASAVNVQTCFDGIKFCMVERTTVAKITISMMRGCSDDECNYGCKMSDWAVTRLLCRECCNSSLCNVGNDVARLTVSSSLALSLVSLNAVNWIMLTSTLT